MIHFSHLMRKQSFFFILFLVHNYINRTGPNIFTAKPTCAGLRPNLSAIATILGSSNSLGSSGLALIMTKQ